MQHIKTLIFLITLLFLEAMALAQSGYQQFNYPNGQVASEGFLRDGKPDGLWKTYYESGQLKSVGKRTDFLLDSTWTFFSEKGDTTLVVNYRKDLKNGPRFTYSETEVLMEPFVNDVRQGEGKRMDRKGHVLQTMNKRNFKYR